MAWLNNLTLQKRIGLFVLIGLVVGLGLFSWLGIQSVNDSVQRTLEERLVTARVMASQVDQHLTHVLMHLQTAAASNGRLPTEKQFETKADSLRQILAESGIWVQYIILIDKDGEARQVEPEASNITGTNMLSYATVEKTLKAGLPTISNLVSSPLIGAPVVLISTPISGEGNETIGALTISVDIEQSNISSSSQTVILGKTGYTEIVDGNGIVLARTTPVSHPEILERSDRSDRFAALVSQGQAIIGTCHRCHETKETLERRRDALAFAPLSTTSWGVAIRQSEEEALAPASQLRQRLLSLGLVLIITTILLVWTMMQGVVKPIRMLTSITKRVAVGDFKAAIPVKRKDEIGQLSSAFYSMIQELTKSRQELTKSRDELVIRNEELFALNSIASTVNQSLNLDDVLGNTLQKVLEATRTTTGCVFLQGADGNKLEMMSSIGLSNIFHCHQAVASPVNCACHQVLHSGQTLMVNDVSQCPMLIEDVVMKEDINCFVSIPLRAKDRTLGIMNIACSNKRCFTENDFRILDSIAYHIGLAIENSILYGEIKQKEELRGQLLSSVINAQEEERKRIARELHDEYGQSLTVLKICLESLENMTASERPQLREMLRNAVALVVNALENLRRLTLDLRPYALDQLGLIAAIRAYVQTHLETSGVQVKLKTKGMSQRLPQETESALFRIIQEAIHNIARHAEAHNVLIQLEVKDEKITAIIRDDGRGFDVDDVFRPKAGAQALGLRGIQERATLLGGTFNIESSPGYGTHLIVEIPIVSAVKESRHAKVKRNEVDRS